MLDRAVGRADPHAEADGTETREPLSAERVEDEAAAGQGTSPFLTLDGFTGPLDHLLTLARAQKIDLSALSITALVDQLATSLRQAPTTLPLGQKGDWVVMAAWLVQLRTRLLLPADAPEQREAAADAEQLRDQLTTLQAMQGLAGWLERRPQLGHEVFARGQPEVFGVSADAGPAADIIAFLWASLALFDDVRWSRRQQRSTGRCTSTSMPSPRHGTAFCSVWRIARKDWPLERLLPEKLDDADGELRLALRHRSAWSSTFVASLELARQGNVMLGQEGAFQTIHVAPVSGLECSRQPGEASNVR